MARSYLSLRDDLNRIVEASLPGEILNAPGGLVQYYKDARDQSWERFVKTQESNERSFARSSMLGVAGGLTAIGIAVAAGPAAVPAAAAISFATGGYWAARGIMNRLRERGAQRNLDRQESLLAQATDNALEVVPTEAGARKNLFSRIYDQAAKLFDQGQGQNEARAPASVLADFRARQKLTAAQNLRTSVAQYISALRRVQDGVGSAAVVTAAAKRMLGEVRNSAQAGIQFQDALAPASHATERVLQALPESHPSRQLLVGLNVAIEQFVPTGDDRSSDRRQHTTQFTPRG